MLKVSCCRRRGTVGRKCFHFERRCLFSAKKSSFPKIYLRQWTAFVSLEIGSCIIPKLCLETSYRPVAPQSRILSASLRDAVYGSLPNPIAKRTNLEGHDS